MMTAVLRSRAIYKNAVGAQDCILKPKDGVLSLKYANSAQRIFQTDFLIEFGNHQIFASTKTKDSFLGPQNDIRGQNFVNLQRILHISKKIQRNHS
jgi:hypothetical protein